MNYLGRLKPFVNDPRFHEAFIEYLDASIDLHRRKLEQSNDPSDLFREQGAIAILKRIKLIRDEVNGGIS